MLNIEQLIKYIIDLKIIEEICLKKLQKKDEDIKQNVLIGILKYDLNFLNELYSTKKLKYFVLKIAINLINESFKFKYNFIISESNFTDNKFNYNKINLFKEYSEDDFFKQIYFNEIDPEINKKYYNKLLEDYQNINSIWNQDESNIYKIKFIVMNHLTDMERKIFIFYSELDSYAEVARLFGVSREYIFSRMKNIRKKIKDKLNDN